MREVVADVTEGGEENGEERQKGAVARTKRVRKRVKGKESGGQKARGGQHAEVIVMEM